MTPRPGRIERIIDIDLPRPRHKAVITSTRFAEYCDEICSLAEADRIFAGEPGVRDLLTRPVGTVTLLNAVAQAQTAFDRTAPAAPEIELSPREKTCLECTARGLTAAQTAREAAIAAATVNYHLQRAAGKLGVSGKHQAVLQAVRLGLIAATEQGQNPAN